MGDIKASDFRLYVIILEDNLTVLERAFTHWDLATPSIYSEKNSWKAKRDYICAKI